MSLWQSIIISIIINNWVYYKVENVIDKNIE